MGPHGTPAGSSAASHSRAGRARMRSPMRPTSKSRLRTRAGLLAKRSSRAQPGSPTISQNFTNWPSLPTATTRKSSLARNTWYGTMAWWALPMRRGASPLAK